MIDYMVGIRYARCAKCGSPRPKKYLSAGSCIVCDWHEDCRKRQQTAADNAAHGEPFVGHVEILDQVHLEAQGIGKPITTQDPLWSPAWQAVRALRLLKDERDMWYRSAIRRAKAAGLPIEQLGRDAAWHEYTGEPNFETNVYRIKPLIP
jgi:hypothetical protein